MSTHIEHDQLDPEFYSLYTKVMTYAKRLQEAQASPDVARMKELLLALSSDSLALYRELISYDNRGEKL